MGVIFLKIFYFSGILSCKYNKVKEGCAETSVSLYVSVSRTKFLRLTQFGASEVNKQIHRVKRIYPRSSSLTWGNLPLGNAHTSDNSIHAPTGSCLSPLLLLRATYHCEQETVFFNNSHSGAPPGSGSDILTLRQHRGDRESSSVVTHLGAVAGESWGWSWCGLTRPSVGAGLALAGVYLLFTQLAWGRGWD